MVAEKSTDVLENLGWHYGDDFFGFAQRHLSGSREALKSTGLDVACNLMLPFQKKNFIHLLKRTGNSGGRLRIFYNAVVNGFQTKSDGSNTRLHQVNAVSPNGIRIATSAPRFIVAAGAIESARLLL